MEKILPSLQDLADETIRKLLFEVALKAVIARAIAAAPFLGFAIINPVFVFLAEKLMTAVYEELSTVVNFAIVDIKVEGERRAYDEAVQRLRDILTVPPIHWDTEEARNAAIEKAKAEFRARLRDLIRLPAA